MIVLKQIQKTLVSSNENQNSTTEQDGGDNESTNETQEFVK